MTTLRIIGMFLMLGAFFGVCWWAFAPSRKNRFSEAASLPFAEDETTDELTTHSSSSTEPERK